eukprot:scaffold11622_cov63-Phaeocystis_antarctica.AAC.6
MGGNSGRRGSSSASGPGGGAAGCDSVCRLVGENGGRRGSSSGWHGAGGAWQCTRSVCPCATRVLPCAPHGSVGVSVALNRCCSELIRALFSSASFAFQAMPRTFSRSALFRPAGTNGRRSWQNSW